MNNVQALLDILQKKGWTLAAIADEIGSAKVTVEKWKSGERYPANSKVMIDALARLARRKAIPKKRRYAPGSRRKERS